MSSFVFSVESIGEREDYLRVEAESAADAGRSLESRGYRKVRLIEDEENVEIRRRIGAPEPAESDLARTKAFEAECRQLTRWEFYWQKVLRPSLPDLLLMTALVVFQMRSRHPWNWISLAIYATAALTVIDRLRRILPGALYHRLLEARAWHRDSTILSTVKSLRALPRAWRQGIPDFELDFSEANAIARRGEMAAAVALARKYEGDPQHQGGAYEARLASVYGSGRQFAERIACGRRALALAPASPSRKIDLATTLAERAGQFAEAAALLDSIPATDLKPLPWVHYQFTRGLIALAAKDIPHASRLFTDARQRATQEGENALIKGFARKIQAYEALTFALRGDHELAEGLWAPVAGYVEATGETELLEAWRKGSGARGA